jgi:hypothetical protein
LLRSGLVAALLAVPGAPDGAAAPVPAAKGGVLVLDNCDPDYRGKDEYADNLSSVDGSGKLAFRVSGLNNCESVGSSHMVAVDLKRGWVWVAENVGHRVRKYDRAGKELLVLPNVNASALAVDPENGELWAVTSTAGRINAGKAALHGRRHAGRGARGDGPGGRGRRADGRRLGRHAGRDPAPEPQVGGDVPGQA